MDKDDVSAWEIMSGTPGCDGGIPGVNDGILLFKVRASGSK